MFRISDSLDERKKRIGRLLEMGEYGAAVMMASAHFEWTLSRSIILLGRSPNKVLWKKIRNARGPTECLKLWEVEVCNHTNIPKLDQIFDKWSELMEMKKKVRNQIAHGMQACSYEYARQCVDYYMEGADAINDALVDAKLDLYRKLKVRKK